VVKGYFFLLDPAQKAQKLNREALQGQQKMGSSQWLNLVKYLSIWYERADFSYRLPAPPSSDLV
jgi:hypothetical protein